jgi:hypothetical protein
MHTMTKRLGRLAAAAMLLVATSAHAIDSCKVRVDRKTGVITVSASGVSGSLAWGNTAGSVTNQFFNAATCVSGSSASRCELADPSTLEAKTPPAGCTLYLTDAVAPCSMWIAGCSPGARSIEDGEPGEPSCGNGVGEAGEACDGLDLNGKSCESEAPSTPFGTLTCSPGCDAVDTSACIPRFKDNGDGTVSDRETNLMWEKKDLVCPGAHCKDDSYPWSTGDPWAPDGTAFTGFLAALNDSLFAGYGDWRIPSINELQGIVKWGPGTPKIDPVFGPTAAFGPDDNDEGCYWTATVATYGPSYFYAVCFDDGQTGVSQGIYGHPVRAVRTGF